MNFNFVRILKQHYVKTKLEFFIEPFAVLLPPPIPGGENSKLLEVCLLKRRIFWIFYTQCRITVMVGMAGGIFSLFWKLGF